MKQGEVLIGSVNIKNIATSQLMDTVSFVFQDTFLFYDTLYENIAVGSPAATKETVVAAAKAAQCHEFIERLPPVIRLKSVTKACICRAARRSGYAWPAPF